MNEETKQRALLARTIAAGLPTEAKRYLRDQLKAVAAGREDIFIGSRRAYLLSEAEEVLRLRDEKIGDKFGAAAIATLRRNIEAAKLSSEAVAVADTTEGPTVEAKEPSDEAKRKLKAALQANAELRRTERAAVAALAVAERDKNLALEELQRIRKKRRSGAEKLRGLFSSPSFLAVPLALIIFASFIHMGIVFKAAFASGAAAWTMAAVFSLVVLVFTFNSEGRRGAAFAIAFAVLEAVINGVYFDFLPASLVPAAATVALPVCILAYTHLFTAKTVG
jgi:hypothetical protein